MGLKRREVLKWAAGAGATMASGRLLLAQAGRAPDPAARGRLRIADLRTYDTGRLYVQVVTDAGIDGWGEINTIPPGMAAAMVATYKPLLMGTDPTRIEHIWQMLFRAHRNVRLGHTQSSAIAGIDVALWDILGKVTGRPICTLLGGPCRGKVLRYPSRKAWKQTSHRLHPMVERPAHLDAIVAALEKTRQKLGADGYLMYDGHGKFTATVAIQLCKRVEHLGLLYFEEVVPPENNADLVRVKRATSVPLAAGERMSTIWSFRGVLADQAADVLNPDVVSIGGISQLRKLATIGEWYDVPIAPHSTHSAIGLAATLHVDAAVSNFLIQEAYTHTQAPFITGLDWSDEEHLPVPTGPGLGVTVNLDGLKEAVAKAAEKPRGIRKAYFLGDGSVADR